MGGFLFTLLLTVTALPIWANEHHDFAITEALEKIGVEKFNVEDTAKDVAAPGIEALMENRNGEVADLALVIAYYEDTLLQHRKHVAYPNDAVARLLRKEIYPEMQIQGHFGAFSFLHLIFAGVDTEGLRFVIDQLPQIDVSRNGGGLIHVVSANSLRERRSFIELYLDQVAPRPQDLAILFREVVEKRDLWIARKLLAAGVKSTTEMSDPDTFYSTDLETTVEKYLKSRFPVALNLFFEAEEEACATTLTPSEPPPET